LKSLALVLVGCCQQLARLAPRQRSQSLRLARFVCLICVLVSFLLALGCGLAGSKAGELPSADEYPGTPPCYAANECPAGYFCNSFGQCELMPSAGPDAGLSDGADASRRPYPPEVENPADPPQGGESVVYVSVPKQGVVVKIDAKSLEVKTIKVKGQPSALRTIPGTDNAVVLNQGASAMTIIRATAGGQEALTVLPTIVGANVLALAPGGKNAVAYFDINRSGGLLAQQSLQELTVLRLEQGKEEAINLSVGFRPSSVAFSADGSAAFVLTEQGISVVDLTVPLAPHIAPLVGLVDDPVKDPQPEEVVIDPNGNFALLRQPGVSGVRVVDLKSKAAQDLDLPGPATDIDLTADGKLALAVLRTSNTVALIDLPADLLDPAGIELLPTGSYVAGQVEVTSDGKTAYLFTNAIAQKLLMVADLKQRSLSTIPLQKAVRNVLLAPDGNVALVVHSKTSATTGAASSLEQLLESKHGYTLLDRASGFTKLQLTDAEPKHVLFAPDTKSAALLLNEPSLGLRELSLIDLKSFLVSAVNLGAPPIALGLVPATDQLYVAQDHALGRITFYERKAGQARTLTGFALNSGIAD
jgi:DNA-binding beta-propeller fold protein YncE